VALGIFSLHKSENRRCRVGSDAAFCNANRAGRREFGSTLPMLQIRGPAFARRTRIA
jgi:hypothetical protein